MQTIYFTTTNFIRHQGNVVDLTEYRRKLALAQGDAQPVEEEVEFIPRPRTNHRRRKVLSHMALDYAASLALIITALSFAVSLF